MGVDGQHACAASNLGTKASEQEKGHKACCDCAYREIKQQSHGGTKLSLRSMAFVLRRNQSLAK